MPRAGLDIPNEMTDGVDWSVRISPPLEILCSTRTLIASSYAFLYTVKSCAEFIRIAEVRGQKSEDREARGHRPEVKRQQGLGDCQSSGRQSSDQAHANFL